MKLKTRKMRLRHKKTGLSPTQIWAITILMYFCLYSWYEYVLRKKIFRLVKNYLLNVLNNIGPILLVLHRMEFIYMRNNCVLHILIWSALKINFKKLQKNPPVSLLPHIHGPYSARFNFYIS